LGTICWLDPSAKVLQIHSVWSLFASMPTTISTWLSGISSFEARSAKAPLFISCLLPFISASCLPRFCAFHSKVYMPDPFHLLQPEFPPLYKAFPNIENPLEFFHSFADFYHLSLVNSAVRVLETILSSPCLFWLFQ